MFRFRDYATTKQLMYDSHFQYPVQLCGSCGRQGGGEYDSSKVRRHSGPLVDKAGLGMLEYVSETYYTKGIILWGVQRDELR